MQSSACITASLGVSLLRNTFLGRFDCPSSPTLESATRQGIASRKLIQTMSGGVIETNHASIGWIDFPMPRKTHKESCREAASLLFDAARLRSNSAGGR